MEKFRAPAIATAAWLLLQHFFVGYPSRFGIQPLPPDFNFTQLQIGPILVTLLGGEGMDKNICKYLLLIYFYGPAIGWLGNEIFDDWLFEIDVNSLISILGMWFALVIDVLIIPFGSTQSASTVVSVCLLGSVVCLGVAAAVKDAMAGRQTP